MSCTDISHTQFDFQGGALYADDGSKFHIQESKFVKGTNTSAQHNDIAQSGQSSLVTFFCPNGTKGNPFQMTPLELTVLQLPPTKEVVQCTSIPTAPPTAPPKPTAPPTAPPKPPKFDFTSFDIAVMFNPFAKLPTLMVFNEHQGALKTSLAASWSTNLSLSHQQQIVLNVINGSYSPGNPNGTAGQLHFSAKMLKTKVLQAWTSVNRTDAFAVLLESSLQTTMPDIDTRGLPVVGTTDSCPHCCECYQGVPLEMPMGDWSTHCGHKESPSHGYCVFDDGENSCVCNSGFGGKYCAPVHPAGAPINSNISTILGAISAVLGICFTLYGVRNTLKKRLRHRHVDRGLPMDCRDKFTANILCVHPTRSTHSSDGGDQSMPMLLAYKHTKEEEHFQQQQIQPANHSYSGAMLEQPLFDEYTGEALNDAARQVRTKGPIGDARVNDWGEDVEDAVSKEETEEEKEEEEKEEEEKEEEKEEDEEEDEEEDDERTMKAEHPGSGAAGDKESQTQKRTRRWWKKKEKKKKRTGTISKRGRK
jgi:hypothetical protein